MTPDERFEKWRKTYETTWTVDRDMRAAWDEQQREIDRLLEKIARSAHKFWHDCREEGYSGPRGASHCAFDGTHVCTVCRLADLEAKLREREEDGKRVMTDLARCAIERDQMKRERDQAVWRDDGRESKLRDALSALEVANISLTDQERKIDELKAKLREAEGLLADAALELPESSGPIALRIRAVKEHIAATAREGGLEDALGALRGCLFEPMPGAKIGSSAETWNGIMGRAIAIVAALKNMEAKP